MMIASAGEERPPPVALGMNVRAFERMLPQVGWVGSTPKPRKLMNASAMMFAPTISDAATMIGLRAFGRMCWKMIRRSRTPTASRRLDELALADRQEQAPHEPAHAHPAEQREDQHDQQRRALAAAEEVRDHEDHEEQRQAEHDVDDPHQEVVGEAADEPGDRTDDACR